MIFSRWVRALACAAAGILMASTEAAIPDAPAGLRPAWVDGFSTVLTWDDNLLADSYNVYRYDTVAQNWALIGSGLLVPMFREAPGQEPPIQYAITAVNAEGEGAAASISIDQGGWPDFTVMFYDPSWYPWLLTSSSVTLQVAASPVSGVDALLEFGDHPASLEFVEYRPAYEGFHSFTVTDLLPGTQYFYRITLTGTNRLGMSVQNSFYTLPENQVPQVSPISMEIWEDAGAPYIVPNGSDVDGPMPLTTRIVTQPASGSVQFDGYYMIYQPEPHFFGTITFTYAMHDGEDESAPATVTITIHPINDPGVNQTPTIELSILEESSASGAVLVTDVENDAHSLELWSWPEAGAVEVSGTSFVYSPSPNYHGVVQFHLAARDSSGVSAEGVTVVTVSIAPVNDDPEAFPADLFIEEDEVMPLILTGSDVDGDSLTYAIEQQPEFGTLSGDAPNLIYTPAPNYHGLDSFTFTVSDGQAQSASAQVSITVTPVNDAPAASAGSATVAEDGSVAIALAGSDSDGDTLTYAIEQQPAHGTLSGAAPNLIYTPAPNYHGPDSFSFTVSDGQAQSASAQVSITVTPVNDAPAASAGSAAVAEDGSIAIALAGSDPDGDALTYAIEQQPAHGSLSGATPNLIYTPAPNYHGPDSFSFTVSDGQTQSASAQVSIVVTPVNDAPAASTGSANVAEDGSVAIALAGSDPDGDTLTYAIEQQPAHGTLSGAAPNLTYTPAPNYHGPDSFSFTVSDGQTQSASAQVSITVTPVNDTPTASAGSATVAEDGSTAIALAGSDPDGDALTYAIEQQPAHGSLSGAAPNLIYTPAPNYHGPDSFSFTVSDGQTQSASAQVSITVTPINDAPTAVPQSVTTPYNTAVSIMLGGNDVDGNPLAFSVATNPANGTLSGAAPNLVFTPNIGWSGTTSFTFTSSDGQAVSAPATVTITVQTTATVPTAPTGLTAQAVSRTQINLAWNDNSNNEDGFKIERSSGSGYVQIATVGPNVRTYSSTGLSANKTYSYRVRAYNVRGNSGYSNIASARTLR